MYVNVITYNIYVHLLICIFLFYCYYILPKYQVKETIYLFHNDIINTKCLNRMSNKNIWTRNRLIHMFVVLTTGLSRQPFSFSIAHQSIHGVYVSVPTEGWKYNKTNGNSFKNPSWKIEGGTWWYDRTGKTNGLIVLSKFVFTVHRPIEEKRKNWEKIKMKNSHSYARIYRVVFVTAVFTLSILTRETFCRCKKGLVICFYLTLKFLFFLPPSRKTLTSNKTRRRERNKDDKSKTRRRCTKVHI